MCLCLVLALGLGHEGAGFHIDERCRDGYERRGLIHVKLVNFGKVAQKLRGDLGNEYLPDIDLRLFDKIEQQVQGAVELLYVDMVALFAFKNLFHLSKQPRKQREQRHEFIVDPIRRLRDYRDPGDAG